MAREIVFKPSRNDLDVLRAAGIHSGRTFWGVVLGALGGALVWGLPTRSWNLPGEVLQAAAVAGWILLALGVLCLLWRRSFSIDRRERTFSTRAGVLFLRYKRVRSLRETQCVELAKVDRGSGDTSETVYPVGIRTAGRLIALSEFRGYRAARAQAETIAKFLDTGMTDTSSGRAVVREAGCLDESLRARAARTREQVDLPEPPADCAIECRRQGPDVYLAWAAFPPKRLRRWFWRSVVLGALGVIWALPIALQSLLSSGSVPWGVLAALIGLTSLPFLTYGFWSEKLARLRVDLYISSGMLRLDRLTLRGEGLREIPLDRLEELEKIERRLVQADDVSPAQSRILSLVLGDIEKRCIMARSDETTLTFGDHLDREDLDWLYAVVRYLVTAPVEKV